MSDHTFSLKKKKKVDDFKFLNERGWERIRDEKAMESNQGSLNLVNEAESFRDKPAGYTWGSEQQSSAPTPVPPADPPQTSTLLRVNRLIRKVGQWQGLHCTVAGS